jgi:TPR repeat protein
LSDIDIGDFEDIKKGIKYLYKSAKCGYHEAQYQLGCCYANGIGVEKNEEQSQYLLQLAAK